jgi:hypothetical protein
VSVGTGQDLFDGQVRQIGGFSLTAPFRQQAREAAAAAKAPSFMSQGPVDD